jgi:hypothetical protein
MRVKAEVAMRMTSLLTALSLFAPAWGGEQAPNRLGFDKAKIGALPEGWKSGVTGKAAGSVWKIVEDTTAPGGPLVLAQTSKNPSSVFNICIAENRKYKDVDIAMAFKPVAGEKDQGGGLIWRVQDSNNYYLVRMNPLEDNFWLYKVVNGTRMSLVKVDAQAQAGKWHTMRVVMTGNKIQCYLNGKLLIQQTDDTITEAGKVGLWTKADAQTYFANVQITASNQGKR